MRVCKHGCDVLDSRIFKNHFIKAIEHFFRGYILASSKHEEGLGEFERVMQTREVVEDLHNFREFSQPLECLDEAM